MTTKLLTLDDYMDQAKTSQGYKSDRELGRALGFKANAVCFWRSKKSWPSDDHMAELASLGGLDPDIAVIHLNVWRNMDNPAAKVYIHLLERIGATAAAILLFIAIFTTDAAAATGPIVKSGVNSLYIMYTCVVLIDVN